MKRDESTRILREILDACQGLTQNDASLVPSAAYLVKSC
jgi:hypothetical protein